MGGCLRRAFCFRTENALLVISKEGYGFYGVEGKDLEGIVSQLRLTAGVEVAIFVYEISPQVFKVSLRSNGKVDVSQVAQFFGGGGHMRAAGCDISGTVYDVINNITARQKTAYSGSVGLWTEFLS